MSKAIRFLEAVGSKPLSPADYAAAVAILEIGDLQRQALMDSDHVALNDLVGGRASMCCMIVAADEVRSI